MNEVYDNIHFVCPTPSINVKLLASSRPGTRMNYNFFMRKWLGEKDENGLRKLRDLLENGTFCDPTHRESSKCMNAVVLSFSYKLQISSSCHS